MERPLDYSKCARPGCDQGEGRVDNYCSVYCRDIDELNIEITQLRERYYKLNANWLLDSASVMWASGWCHVCGHPILFPNYYHATDCAYEAWAVEHRPKKE